MRLDPVNILKEHDLKHTRQRVRVLEEIALDTVAISQPELEKKLGKEIDRVTLYRILNTYEDKGILHRIMDMNGTANYAICSSSCSEDHHHDEHVHFNCTTCSKIYCLEVVVPKIKMPKGFTAKTVNTTAYGTCEKCNALLETPA
ncbi:Fur family transcriptional regulator, ferric uptake regulator [Pedobacter steynii]|uniref:Fur family transcriptional regulator, ferric uptake regulator n=1 Tax=Pedobacter steynii TaxID=430522 RepID=A0A1G9RYK1_9SPHI|nr:transcriptional repressor [Pedobacter steynii]NQX37601.1 transcriptional repressor [Pedobacter steynii]SDM28339.1 Fur family transcriptional regulator, ferric uptake regulator [Pedobacter steynii]